MLSIFFLTFYSDNCKNKVVSSKELKTEIYIDD